MKKFSLLIIAVVTLVVITSDAQSQDRYYTQVLTQLESVGEHMRSEGFRSHHRTSTGSMYTGAAVRIDFELFSGTKFVFVGACDANCSDMDLILRDASGAVVSSDTAEGDVPVIIFDPTRAGTYSVTVRMTACSAEPCRYGLAAYAR